LAKIRFEILKIPVEKLITMPPIQTEVDQFASFIEAIKSTENVR